MNTQICSRCGIEKPLEDFYFRKDQNKYRRDCKECRKKRDIIYYQNNKEKRKLYVKLNKEHFNELRRAKYKENEEYKNKIKENCKIYREKHRDILNEHSRQYRKEHQQEITQKRKEKRHNDEKYYFEIYLRNKINNYLYRYGKITKKNNVQEILGCSYQEFKKYIENKFEKGMNWNNRGKWHLDHIIPLSTAKDYDDLVKLNHYTNFQPLWAIDNLKKGSKIKGGIV